MRAVTFQAPGEVRVEDVPAPVLGAPDDAIVRVEATGVCGSDLHIYHGRVKIEPGFVIGHEFVGTVIAAGEAVTRVQVGERVLGCFHTACGECFFCLRGLYQKCREVRVFGHGATLGSLPGSQAEQVLVPRANMVLRRVPDGLSTDAALFAGDVMATGYHAVTFAWVAGGIVAAARKMARMPKRTDFPVLPGARASARVNAVGNGRFPSDVVSVPPQRSWRG